MTKFKKMHPVEIYRYLEETHGTEWAEWDAEALLLTVEPEDAVDKVLAVQAVVASPELTLTDAIAFENVVNAFCNNFCIADEVQPPEIEEVMYAVRQIREVLTAAHGVAKDGIAFSGQVPGYVAAVGKYRDWVLLPHRLAFAQEMLNALLGLQPGTEKWKASASLIKAGELAVAHLSEHGFDPKNLEALDAQHGEGFAASFVGRLVGSYLFDPVKAE